MNPPARSGLHERWPRSWAIFGSIVLSTLLLTSCASRGGGGTPTPNDNGSTDSNVEQPGKFDAKSTMATIQTRGNLLVGVVDDTQPFAYQDKNTGTWSGFDIEIVKEIAIGIFGSKIEGKITYVPLDSRDRELALEQNKVDIVVGRYAITVARKKFVDFAGPYYITSQNAVISGDRAFGNGDDEISSLTDLNGRKVCVVTGSTDIEALQAVLPAANMTNQVKTVGECGALLTQGKVDAVVADHVDLLGLIDVSGGKLQRLPGKFADQPYGVGVHKGATDLRQFINDRLSGKIKEKYSTLLKNSILNDDDTEQPDVDRY